MIINRIQPTDTYNLRQCVLKTSKAYEYKYHDDFNYNTKHYGARIGSELIGILSLMRNKHTSFTGLQFQIRGMAVLKIYQGKRIGAKLIETALKEIDLKSEIIVWCNARESAVDFYKKIGFKIKGERFYIENVCFHYVMYRIIK